MKTKNNLRALLYVVSILWVVWLIVKSYPTKCFSYFDTYMTLIIIISSMIVNDLMNNKKLKR